MSNLKRDYEALGASYSKAHGAFIPPWNTDVNLSPPEHFGQKEVSVEDKYIKDYYDTLQYTLLETDHPETIDRTATPRIKHNSHQVTVAILSSPCEIIGLLLEGGKQVPDAFHLILSTTWLSNKSKEGLTSDTGLWIHKAITFHTNGQTFIDVFTPARKVTYFINFFTDAITAGQKNDGEKLEVGLECPMSSCVQLSELVDNKVWTRSLMADIGVAYPITLAFMYQPKHVVNSIPLKIRLVDLQTKDRTKLIVENLSSFLNDPIMREVHKIVVKPSGPDCYGSLGVTFHRKSDENEILDAVFNLLKDIKPGYSILHVVEEFIEPLLPRSGNSESGRLWAASEDISFRLRATVYRDFNDIPVTTMINCGMQDKFQPISGDNTVTQSLDSTLLTYNINGAGERRAIETMVRNQSENLLSKIIEEEKVWIKDNVDCPRAQTEVIGVDIVLTEKDGHLIPVCIEANSHDCTINCQIYEFLQNLYDSKVFTDNEQFVILDKRTVCGESYLPWIRNIMVRSQRYLMENKTILVVGSGGYSKRYIWQTCQEYKINVILIDSDPECSAKDQVRHFINYNYLDHLKDKDHAMNITNILHNNDITVDGCLTFWEDCGPLAALLREQLNLSNSGVSFEAAIIAKKKSRTLEVIRSRKDDTPHWPRAYLYSSASHRISDRETLCTANNKGIQFPAIVKMEHGSSAVGVKLVHNKAELAQHYDLVSQTINTEADFPGIGLGFNNSMLVMEYHKGSEHDVDVVIFERRLIAAFVSDNGPTRNPTFLETATTMPSVLPKDKQAQLVAAAYQCCIEIGLINGTFNVELKMTETGPKLMEINARMGGIYLRDWIKRLYDVDLMLVSIMIACGIKPYIPRRVPSSCIMGVMLLPSLHKHVIDSETNKEKLTLLNKTGGIIWNQFSRRTDSPSKVFEEPFGNIAVIDIDHTTARKRLLSICEDFGIVTPDYDVSLFTRYFC